MIKFYNSIKFMMCSILLLIGAGSVNGQVLLDEDFDYGGSAGDLTTVSGGTWSSHSGTTAVGYATTSLSMTGYPASGVGGSATFDGANSQDVNSPFTSQSSGNLYASALMNISSAGTTDNYFWHLRNASGAFFARVYAKDDGAGNLEFGIREDGAATTAYTSGAFSYNTTYLVIVKYDFTAGEASLFILDAVTGTEPAADAVSNDGTDPTELAQVAIRQSTNIPTGTIDGVRVTTSWADIMADPVNTLVEFSSASASINEGDGTYNLTLSITNPDGSNATSVDVALTSGDAADINTYTTQTATFAAGSSADETVTLTITDDALYEGIETLTFTLQNPTGGNSAALGAQTTFELTIEDNDPLDPVTLPYSETFDTDLSGVYTYSIAGNTKEWYHNGDAAEMNGYNSGELERDWLILPPVNLDNYTNEIISFETEYQFGVESDANNFLTLVYSTNYSGIGDPSAANWFELPYTAPSSQNTVTATARDISFITGTEVYFAFWYEYESGNYRRWTIDNITIQEESSTLTVSESFNPNFGSVDNGAVSNSDDMYITGSNLSGNVTVFASDNFEVSLDNVTFSSSVDLVPAAGVVDAPVYIRFAPNTGINQTINGLLRVYTPGTWEQFSAVTGTETGNYTVLYAEDFSSCVIGDYNTQSVIGAEVWECTGFGQTGDAARMNGYNSGAQDNEDWLITPAIDLSTATNATLTFYTDVAFPTGTQDLTVLYSTDYPGSGAPSGGVWTELSAVYDTDSGNDTWTSSSDIDLSAQVGNTIYLAFKYVSTTSGAAQWTVDDILIEDRAPLLGNIIIDDTGFNGNFGYVNFGNSSDIRSYLVSGTELSDDVTITPPVGFELSLTSDFSGTVYNNASPLVLTQSGGVVASATIYVRFTPDAADGSTDSGNIIHASIGASEQSISVLGTEGAAPTFEILISEVADPADVFGARFVELYNPSGSAVSLDNYYLSRQSNGGSTWNDIPLTGSIPAGGTFVIANNSTDFDANYGISADMYNTGVTSNGDDGYHLFFNGDHTLGTLVDSYGVIDEDGTGMAWEFLDSRAVRNSDISAPNTTWTASEWTVSFPTIVNTDGFTPGVHPDPAETISVDQTGFDGNFGFVELGSSSDIRSYDVSGSDLIADITITPPIGIEVSTTSDLSSNIGTNASPLVLVQSAGTVATTTIYVRYTPQAADETVSDNITHESGSAITVNVAVEGREGAPTITDISAARALAAGTEVTVQGIVTTPDYGFNNGQYYIQDATGGINIFHSGNRGLVAEGDEVEITGNIAIFNDLIEIEPSIVTVLSSGNTLPTATAIAEGDLTVDNAGQGTRVVIENVTLVDAAQWPVDAISAGSNVDVDATVGSTSFQITIDRGESFYDGSPVPDQPFILTGILTRDGTNVQILPFFDGDIAQPAPVATITVDQTGFTTDFGQVEVGSNASAGSYLVEGSDLSSDISITASGDFEIALSNDNAAFSNAITLSQIQGFVESTQIFVRFSPSAVGAATGTITHSSTDVTDVVINVSGEGVEMVTAIEDAFDGQIRLFPNPVTNYQVTLEMTKSVGRVEVSVMTIDGSVVKQQTVEGNTDIQLGALKSGVYFIKVANEDKANHYRIVVK